MLNISITPTSLVFVNLTDEIFATLKDNFGIDFVVDNDTFKVVDTPEYLFKLLYRLSFDYDIELN